MASQGNLNLSEVWGWSEISSYSNTGEFRPAMNNVRGHCSPHSSRSLSDFRLFRFAPRISGQPHHIVITLTHMVITLVFSTSATFLFL